MAEPEILLREQGALGRITLNRPKALNSLTLGMVRTMAEALQRWRDADHVRAVLIDGAGERGLCAGGDVRALTKALNAALNGRGGGKPGICQGSCAATPEQVEDFLKENIDHENAL